MRIDGNISDLFFNRDFAGVAIYNTDGTFSHYDHVLLLDEAEMFLGCLERLNVTVPGADDLIADFYARL